MFTVLFGPHVKKCRKWFANLDPLLLYKLSTVSMFVKKKIKELGLGLLF